jgi:hypothetical protein
MQFYKEFDEFVQFYFLNSRNSPAKIMNIFLKKKENVDKSWRVAHHPPPGSVDELVNFIPEQLFFGFLPVFLIQSRLLCLLHQSNSSQEMPVVSNLNLKNKKAYNFFDKVKQYDESGPAGPFKNNFSFFFFFY